MGQPIRLTPSYIDQACSELRAIDPMLGVLVERNGSPPLWRRTGSYATLIKLILEQQVSLASAAATYRKLEDLIGPVTAGGLLMLNDEQLRSAGFSRQKTRYSRILATAISDGSLKLRGLAGRSDSDVQRRLTALVGIGPWTAANYCLFALGRPDIWPDGDRALVVSMQRNLDLEEIPDYPTAASIAERWRPWRSVAARLLWHDYLGGPSYDPSSF